MGARSLRYLPWRGLRPSWGALGSPPSALDVLDFTTKSRLSEEMAALVSMSTLPSCVSSEVFEKNN